ncbi:general L-amino acid transport system substrate-binding protein [Phreatobacter oligotrophus]|uniref:General L-amino acid transport system substrate-binding protein n=1 Tax=Phreatobacter oligotrophus TaxID=1122261 RepID=A0A2T4ZHT5_9HYPH|nr:general L-amino acid transport system substrate-binding protein [Phreatobacter oligotrophus]
MTIRTILSSVCAAALVAIGADAALAQAPSTSATLARVKERGVLECGANQGVPGFSMPDSQGRWTGFDVDYCRALAAAIFDDPTKVRFSPLSSKDRFIALQSSQIDVLARQTTWTISREISQGIAFTAINYYDGQGFLVRKSLGVKSALEFAGATVCVPQGTTSELNAADYFRTHNIRYQMVAYATVDEVIKAYESGRCDTYTTDMSALAGSRFLMQNPDDHIILPEVISKEPLGPWVRKGDAQWFDIVRWTLFAMIAAEELGITQANVQEMLKSPNPEIRRLLGVDSNYGETLGLTRDWALRIIRHIGNYGESFDRNLGARSRIGLPRGPNRLWNVGGLQYAPPFR